MGVVPRVRCVARSGTRRIIDLGASQRQHLIRSAGNPGYRPASFTHRVTTIDPFTPRRSLVSGRVTGTQDDITAPNVARLNLDL